MVQIHSRLNIESEPRTTDRIARTPTGRTSQAGYSSIYPKLDLNDPAQFAQSVRNVQSVHDITPEDVRESGRTWYPRIHDIAERGAGGNAEKGAGLVAVLSPQADFSSGNIPAFHDLKKLNSSDWKAIQAAAESGSRTQEVTDILKGTRLSNSSGHGLMRAYRIMQGEDPESVINRQTSPKEHSFFHNILEPETPGHVTIDYRAHDIAANSMQPATYSGRGISSAQLKSGKPSRYEKAEDVYRAAAAGRDIELPHQMQAITWEGGKRIETSAPTKSGKPRVKGVPRKGQPYVEQ